MSKQDARKVTIIEELLAGRFNNNQAAELLGLSVRQVQRMKVKASANGVTGILHKNISNIFQIFNIIWNLWITIPLT